MRMRRKDRMQNPVQNLAAPIQRPELDGPAASDNLERRARRGDVPAGVAARILVSGRKIDPAIPVKLAQQFFQALAIRGLGACPSDSNATAREILERPHGSPRGLLKVFF